MNNIYEYHTILNRFYFSCVQKNVAAGYYGRVYFPPLYAQDLRIDFMKVPMTFWRRRGFKVQNNNKLSYSQ